MPLYSASFKVTLSYNLLFTLTSAIALCAILSRGTVSVRRSGDISVLVVPDGSLFLGGHLSS